MALATPAGSPKSLSEVMKFPWRSIPEFMSAANRILLYSIPIVWCLDQQPASLSMAASDRETQQHYI